MLGNLLVFANSVDLFDRLGSSRKLNDALSMTKFIVNIVIALANVVCYLYTPSYLIVIQYVSNGISTQPYRTSRVKNTLLKLSRKNRAFYSIAHAVFGWVSA